MLGGYTTSRALVLWWGKNREDASNKRLIIMWRKDHTVLFSERYGYRKIHYWGPIVWQIGGV